MHYITKIQKYSVHDGDGIRTTVFFKGCPLKCTWCHNPETQKFNQQLSVDFERCLDCNRCQIGCSKKVVNKSNNDFIASECQSCGECIDYCDLNLRELTGKEYEIKDLVRELQKDEVFYEDSGGGITLSGGEVMCMDIDYIYELVKAINKKGMSINIDTCGYTDFKNFEKIYKYVDTFLYDIKAMDKKVHKEHIGVDNDLILENLKKLSDLDARINIRIPLIKEVNASANEIKAIIEYLKDNQIKVAQVNLLPYHNTGSGKYSRIGLDYQGVSFNTPTDYEMEEFKLLFNNAGYNNVKIGG